MDIHIAQLLTNNDAPDEAMIRKARCLLEIPLQELSQTDADIAGLEEQLKLLKGKREKSERSINDFQTVLAPIRRLHDDILEEIFYRCLPTQRNSALIALDAPLLLTRVCSKWRHLAMSFPRLWAQLHITFCDDYRTSAEPGMHLSEDDVEAFGTHASSVLGLRVQVVKEWLSRSGTCPLDISLHYSSDAFYTSDFESRPEGDLTIDLFKTLLSFSHRWRDLELVMPMEFYRKLETLILSSGSSLSSLKGVKLNLHQQMPEFMGQPMDMAPIALFQANGIQRLSLAGTQTRSLAMNSPLSLAAIGQNLTYLCSYFASSAIDAFELLKLCENLVHCKLYITSNYGHVPPLGNEEPVDLTLFHGTAYLLRLKSLAILEDIADDNLAIRFYTSIHAPNLRWLDYQRPHHTLFGDHDDPPVTSAQPPIFSFLSKLCHLKKLTVDPRGFPPGHLREALEMVSSTLTHLVIGHELSGRMRMSLNIRRRRFNPLYRLPQNFDLEWLCESFSPNTKASHGRPSKLDANDIPSFIPSTPLPRLITLDWSTGSGSDELLLRFITERMNAAASGEPVASLKRVWIAYDRLQELNVLAEFARFREAKLAETGVMIPDVKLELDYLTKEHTKEDEPLSAVFGLTSDGRSWSYDDIQELMVPD